MEVLTTKDVSDGVTELKNSDVAELNKRIEVVSLDQPETNKSDAGSKENPRYVITRNECLENDKHPVTGVEFKRKTVETPSGEYIEGVFPEFDSKFSAEIPKELYLESDKKQFQECNSQLNAKIEKDPELKKQFSEDQLEQIKEGIKDGSAPDGYVWHHEPESGRLSLVNSETHAQTGHTGGRVIWGGGSDNR